MTLQNSKPKIAPFLRKAMAAESGKKKKNFMAPFYGWGSTASRLEPLWGGSLLFTTRFSEIPGTHFIDLGRTKGWVDLDDINSIIFTILWTLRTFWISIPVGPNCTQYRYDVPPPPLSRCNSSCSILDNPKWSIDSVYRDINCLYQLL